MNKVIANELTPVSESARQLVTEAKAKTNTFREAMLVIREKCVEMPSGSGANVIHERAMSLLFTEMYDAPHGGITNEGDVPNAICSNA